MPVLRYSIALIVVLLCSNGVRAQCAAGEEVCLQESEGANPQYVEESTVTLTDEITTETYSEEQEQLVAGITSDLRRRSLTRPSGNNAFEKIVKLREIHPLHDYSVNGEKYIARILILLGRQAAERGDLDLASRHLLKAIKFDPGVRRQEELKKTIAVAARAQDTKDKTESATAYLPSEPQAVNPQPAAPQVARPAVGTDEIKFVAPAMVAIPAGNFLMGSELGAEDEKPVHHVTLEAFSMSKHEVTMQQYRVFALATGRPAPQYLAQDSNLPITNISWHDANAYARWLSNKTKRRFRLPTESEWEYAARAGTTTRYNTGDSLVNAANCVGCGGQWSGKAVAPVGSFAPNEFGLFDVHGNVWEWVSDCWTNDYNGRTKSAASFEFEDCNRRVLRGGSWYNDADYARASYRGNEIAGFRDDGVGFRVVHEGL